jgi:hypothetical protein
MPRKTLKNPITDPTGEKARKNAEPSIGEVVADKAKELQMVLEPIVNTVSNVANVATTTYATTTNAINNVKQAIAPNGTGYKFKQASSNIKHTSDAYGGLAIPDMQFNGMIPGDLLHPENANLPQITENELTTGLAIYAGAIRAQKLYQSGFKYIEEVGRTKQQYHKAQQSVIKASTEDIKVKQEVVRFDRQNVELSIDFEKLEHSNERLKQAQITTVALRNETSQIGRAHV